MRPVRWLAAAVLMLAAPAGAQLCPPAADPCIVASSVTVNDAVVDLGNRALVVKASRTISVRPVTFHLLARSVLLEPGARILGLGLNGFGTDMTITTTDDVVLQRAGTSVSKIDVSANTAGGFLYLFAGGDLLSDGLLDARGLDGGSITITASGSVALGGSGATAAGESGGGGGTVIAAGATGLSVAGLVDVSATGGRMELSTEGDLHVGPTGTLDARATGDDSAGSMLLTAAGMVELDGAVDGRAAVGGDGVSGASLTVRANGGDVAIGGPIDVSGASGGEVHFHATGDIVQANLIDAAGKNIEGFGGEVLFEAAGGIGIGPVDAHGGNAGGDFISAKGVAIVVAGNLSVSGTGGEGGTIDLHGCQVEVPAGVTLSALGPGGANVLRANGAMTIQGSLTAGLVNRLEYATVPPSILLVPVPPPQLVLTPLPPCGVGASTTTTTSTTSTTVTTSTSTTTTTTTRPSTTTTTVTTSTTTTTTSTTTTTKPTTTTTTSTTATTSTAPSSTTTSTTTTTTTTTTRPPSTSTTSTTVVTTTSTARATTSTTSISPVPTTTTSTTLAPGCVASEGFAAVRCDLAAASAGLATVPAGRVHDVILAKLARATLAEERAVGRCRSGETAAARRGMGSAIRRLRLLGQRIGTLVRRGLLAPEAGAGLLTPIADALEDLRVLRPVLSCPRDTAP